MKLKPVFYMDPNAPHCYRLLPSVPGTVPAQGYLYGLQCLQLCWLGAGLGFLSTGMYTVSTVQAVTEWSSVGLGL